MPKLLSTNVTKDKFGDIIINISYSDDLLVRRIEHSYQRRTLLYLLKQQDKNDFMQYQFRYIIDRIPYVDVKDALMCKINDIRKDVLKLLDYD